MSTRINHNVLSLNAQRNIYLAQKDLDEAVIRLSSGLRINNAWDDPAGLNLSERFRAQISSLEEAERNAQQAINLIQMADGALSVIDEKLIRMRALSIQASNGVLSDQDRMALHREFDNLRSEVTRIALSTNYNGLFLLDGSLSGANRGIKLHIGPYNVKDVDYYYVSFGDARSEALGLDQLDLTDTISAQFAIDVLDEAINIKDEVRTRLGSSSGRLQNTVLNLMISHESSVNAESMIRDADIAEEMSNFTRAQILMQAGVSMLTQANMVPQIVAQLIR